MFITPTKRMVGLATAALSGWGMAVAVSLLRVFTQPGVIFRSATAQPPLYSPSKTAHI